MAPSLAPGDLVERYRVELQLGRGGMAVVYRVRHLTLGTLHALKVLQVDDPAVRERLVTEGRVQARFRHDNVVNVTDVLDLDGSPALLMDFVGGGSLADRLAAAPLPRDEALALFTGIVGGVAHAHAHGLVHRDLKPANVLLDLVETGPPVPKVTDFGLARLVDETMHREHHTRQGQAMGTPAYMAPEQIRDAASADQRADVYSLGVMLYELVCGVRPFEAPDVLSLMYKVASGAYRPPEVVVPDLPEALRAAIGGAMARDRDQRIPDCKTLLEVLSGARSWQVPAPAGAITAAPLPELDGAAPSQTWDPAAPSGDEASQTFAFDEPLPAPPADPPAALPAALPADPPAVLATPGRPRQTLAPATEVGAERSRSVAALVVDEAGQGHVVELVVTLMPGGSGVWAPDGVGRDARVAAQLAIAVALGPEAPRFGARWGVRGGPVDLYGTSIGLAVAVAARAAWQDLPLPAGWALTGGVDLDGRVASVGGLPAKARAAAAAGLSRVAAPAVDVQRAPPVDGVELVGITDLDQAARSLLPAPPPARRWRRLPALLVVPVLAFLGALALPEAWLHHGLLLALRGPVALENTAILGIDVPDARTLRPRHAETLRALADAGARAVLVDLAFGTAQPEVDEELARAIAEVEAGGMPVVLAVRFASEQAQWPGSPALREVGHHGSVEAATAGPLGHVVGVRVRRRDDAQLWHTAALAAAAVLGAGEPRLDGGDLVVGPTRNPTTREVLALPPFDNDPLVVTYGDTAAYGSLRGRVVVMGAWNLPRDHHPTAGGPRYGTELQAAAVETILRQAAPRRLAPEWDALASLLSGAGVLALGLALPRRQRALALLVPAALLAIGAALGLSGLLLGLLGVLLGAAAGAWVLKGAAPPR